MFEFNNQKTNRFESVWYLKDEFGVSLMSDLLNLVMGPTRFDVGCLFVWSQKEGIQVWLPLDVDVQIGSMFGKRCSSLFNIR